MDLLTIIIVILAFAVPTATLFYMEKILNLIGINTDDMLHFSSDADRTVK